MAARLHEMAWPSPQLLSQHGAIWLRTVICRFSSSEQSGWRSWCALTGANSNDAVQELSKQQSQRILQLCILLRLAVLLRRSHSEKPQPSFRLTTGNKSLKLEFPSGWLGEHPLTEADLAQEAAYLQAAKFQLSYC